MDGLIMFSDSAQGTTDETKTSEIFFSEKQKTKCKHIEIC